MNPMNILNYIIGITCVYIILWPYGVKFVCMNEADYVLDKESSLVEVPYVEPSVFENLDVKSIIQKFHSLWMNDMKDIRC